MASVGGYLLKEKLYTCTHSQIYRGLNLANKKSYILKVPKNDQVTLNDFASLKHEYTLLKDLNLPGVVKAYEFINNSQFPALVLDDSSGISLEIYLAAKPLALDKFFLLALQIVDILGSLHQKHIIHKDIKPANILIEPDSNILKLIDLSISSQLIEEKQADVNPNKLEGTIGYLSPEQTGRMNLPIDFRSDFYSLGVTFFEMLTGRLPFQATDILELVHCHLAKNPPLAYEINPKVPVMLALIIKKLMAKMPEDRYCSIVGLKADLVECEKQWSLNGKINNFTLAQHDIFTHLHLSHKLYGRDEQLSLLLEAFERISEKGEKEVVLITGVAGIGKTSIVKEIYKPLSRQKGYFIQGKFEQLQHSIPYSAIASAFGSLIKQVLAEPEEKLNTFRQSLQIALDGKGQVISRVIPEVELLIGQQHEANYPDTLEATKKFILAFQDFIQVFAKSNHPLVLFLDDLQWADSASLNLIQRLLTNIEAHYFLLIGSYRDNEVDAEHPLQNTLKVWKQENISVHHLVLEPLTEEAIANFLADSLHSSIEKAQPLADLVQEKTGGNPFFINEFIDSLYKNKLLYFSYDTNGWEWDTARIQRLGITANVINLLTVKIQKLSIPAQEILKLAACIGYNFDLKTLTIISQQPMQVVAKQLWEAIAVNLIFPTSENYKLTNILNEVSNENLLAQVDIGYQFIHDQIQQAAHELIPKEIRQEVHLTIGRLLLKKHLLSENDEQLFIIVNHFNQALDLIQDNKEALMLAEYNLWAAQKAKTNTAYMIARGYLQTGILLFTKANGAVSTDLSYKLHKELIECFYLLGEFKQAELLCKELLQQYKETTKQIEVYSHYIAILFIQNQIMEAISVGLAGLKVFGINLPSNINKPYPNLLNNILINLRINLIKSKEIPLKPAINEDYKAILKVMNILIHMAHAVNANLALLLLGKMVKICLKYGYSEETGMWLIVYSGYLMTHEYSYRKAFKVLKLTHKLRKIYHFKSSYPREEFMLGSYVYSWIYPLEKSLEHYTRGYQAALETGDLAYAHHSLATTVATLLIMGKPLSEVDAELQKVQIFRQKKAFGNYFLAAVTHMDLISKYLQNEININRADFDKQFEALKIIPNKMEISATLCRYTQLWFILGEADLALQIIEYNQQYIRHSQGSLVYSTGIIFHALSLAACYQNVSSRQKRNYLKKIKSCYKKIYLWAKHCPENFQHSELLIAAELARLEDKILLAQDLYDKAIEAATKSECLSMVGVANECAAKFYLALKKPHLAKGYIQSAYNAYEHWGATAKCEQIKKYYSEYYHDNHLSTQPLAMGTNSLTSSTNYMLDFMAIFKANQAISSEIQLDKLLQKLLGIVLEEAGAQRGIMLVKKEGAWLIEAEVTLEKQNVYLIEHKALDECNDLPIGFINYVARTHETKVISDEQIFAQDPYLQQSQVKSLLILPIFYQGNLTRILYVEHQTLSNVFTPQHIQSLQLLASQAAISLENAYLYYEATHDLLTGLANRNLLYRTFKQTLAHMQNENKQFAILFLDLDYFKKINDTLGHDVGDKLLQYFADQIRKCLGQNDIGARLGGDEFVMVLENVESISRVKTIANSFYQSLERPVIINGHKINISSSIGISMFPQDAQDMHNLLKKADMALYKAKEKGKNNYQFYSDNYSSDS